MIARTLVLLALLAFVGPDAAAFDVGGSGVLGPRCQVIPGSPEPVA